LGSANGDRAPFVKAIPHWRKANRLLQVLQSMRDRQVDGILAYGFKYFGAHTGRWSGDLGLNLQNLPREAFAGVDARACFVPRPGKRFIIADFAQIEARITLWLAGDESTLALLRGGMDLYEAHARQTMGYTDPRPLKDVDKNMRNFAKCRVLALGFQVGGATFQTTVKQWTGMDVSLEKARTTVADFRRKNPGIIRLWNRLERELKQSCGGSFELELLGGRIIRYFDVSRVDSQWKGRVERGGKIKSLYGDKLTENIVQATARDLFGEAILRLERAGLPVVLHVHDEVVVEVDETAAADAERAVKEIMCVEPAWASGLPIMVETQIAEAYTK
jgi:DNA polymerase I-like protein with 3'-5' exonuclease and polymerase domains